MAFRGIILCNLVSGYHCLWKEHIAFSLSLLLHPEDEGIVFLWNVGSHPTRLHGIITKKTTLWLFTPKASTRVFLGHIWQPSACFYVLCFWKWISAYTRKHISEVFPVSYTLINYRSFKYFSLFSRVEVVYSYFRPRYTEVSQLATQSILVLLT
jgi:hypothetical protein